jgi:hypothetical protein
MKNGKTNRLGVTWAEIVAKVSSDLDAQFAAVRVKRHARPVVRRIRPRIHQMRQDESDRLS